MDTIFHLAFTLLTLSLIETGQIPTTVGECRYNYEKAGCFHDQALPDRPLTIQMLNRRDPSSKVWDGELIDWNHYHKTLHSLACKCAELAIKKGFPYFGLQYYGECWSGPRHQNYTRDGPSNDCIGVTYKPCVDNSPTECIGKGFTNYIYRANEPIDGGWSQWSDFTSCLVTCGLGFTLRKRTCTNPIPKFGGKHCIGPKIEPKECKIANCSIHGQWTEWSTFGLCSKSCGGGVATRTRTCTNPLPKFGGNDCNGTNIVNKECQIANCPIHGQWTEWSTFGLCSKPCGDGVETRTRTCTNPSPKFGGNDCAEENSNSRACSLRGCDGGWSSWSPYGQCSKTCGKGFRVGRRTCTNPSPLLQGKQCPGSYSRQTKCNDRHCLFTEWSLWGACSKTCVIRHGGTKVRRRTCSSSTPDDCIGSVLEIKNCPEKSTILLCLIPNPTPKECNVVCRPIDYENRVCASHKFEAQHRDYLNNCAFLKAKECLHTPLTFEHFGRCLGSPV